MSFKFKKYISEESSSGLSGSIIKMDGYLHKDVQLEEGKLYRYSKWFKDLVICKNGQLESFVESNTKMNIIDVLPDPVYEIVSQPGNLLVYISLSEPEAYVCVDENLRVDFLKPTWITLRKFLEITESIDIRNNGFTASSFEIDVTSNDAYYFIFEDLSKNTLIMFDPELRVSVNAVTSTSCSLIGPKSSENLLAKMVSGTLQEIHAQDLYGVTRLPANFGNGCYDLKYVEFPETLTHIDGGIFDNSKSVEVIKFPKSLKYMNGYIFASGLTSMKEVHYAGTLSDWCDIFPGTLNSILRYQSNVLISLYIDGQLIEGRLAIPEAVEQVSREYLFSYFPVTSVRIPEPITKLPRYCFSECTRLKDIILPKTLKEANYSFDSCTALTTVYYEGTEAEWAVKHLGGVNPKIYYYSENAPGTSGNYWHYDNSGNPVIWNIS